MKFYDYYKSIPYFERLSVDPEASARQKGLHMPRKIDFKERIMDNQLFDLTIQRIEEMKNNKRGSANNILSESILNYWSVC